MRSRKPFIAGNGNVTLWFDLQELRPVVDYARTLTDFSASDGPVPGLVLIGDAGVYLVSNGQPAHGHAPTGLSGSVVYAAGCDPTKDDFEDWWPVHNAIDQGNDFAIFVPLDEFEGVLPDCRECVSIVVGPEYFSVRRDPR